jgi:hypothetical protein
MKHLNEFDEFNPDDFADFDKEIDNMGELGYNLKPIEGKDYWFGLNQDGKNDGETVLFLNKFAKEWLEKHLEEDFGRKFMSSWNSVYGPKGSSDHFPNFKGIEGIRRKNDRWGPDAVKAFINSVATGNAFRYYASSYKEKMKDLYYIRLSSAEREFPALKSSPLGRDRIKRMYAGILKYIEDKSKMSQ